MQHVSGRYLTRNRRSAMPPTGRVLALAILAAAAALTLACIIPPGDVEQIRALVHDREAALARNDVEALYRLHDLDFRSICPLDRFRSLPRQPEVVRATRDLQIRGSRAWATLDLAADGDRGGHSRHLDFVKDAGRWYLYEGAEQCLRGFDLRLPGSEHPINSNSELGTRNSELVTVMTVTHG
ncbi:MAG: nuclear transport factor 2 family protein [Dehalococcoidia bacterium]